MNGYNNIVVIFEGADGVGKTTAKARFEQLTGYRYACIDRWFVSQAVYGIKYPSPIRPTQSEVLNSLKSLLTSFFVVIVLIYSDSSRKLNENSSYNSDIELFNSVFRSYKDELYFSTDSSRLTNLLMIEIDNSNSKSFEDLDESLSSLSMMIISSANKVD
jgi:hypothetical protein